MLGRHQLSFLTNEVNGNEGSRTRGNIGGRLISNGSWSAVGDMHTIRKQTHNKLLSCAQTHANLRPDLTPPLILVGGGGAPVSGGPFLYKLQGL